MEDIRNGIRYVIWGTENQYVPDPETPFKVMGYDYTLYDRQIEEFAAQNEKNGVKIYTGRILPEQKIKPVITLVLYYGKEEIPLLRDKRQKASGFWQRKTPRLPC